MSREGEIPEVASGVEVVERPGVLAVVMSKVIIGLEVTMMMVSIKIVTSITKIAKVTTKIVMVTAKTVLRNL